MKRLLLCHLICVASVFGAAVKFDIPAQPTPDALMAFAKQADAKVLFSHNELKGSQSPAVAGEFEPLDALGKLLTGTGYTAHLESGNRFLVARVVAAMPGGIEGMVRDEGTGKGVEGAKVVLLGTEKFTTTDKRGRFTLDDVPAGEHQIEIAAPGRQRAKVTDVTVKAGHRLSLSAIAVPALKEGVEQMEPFLVSAKKMRA